MDQVEEIKQKLDVAEVVGSYVQLKQSGRNLKAPCPFHQEKTASFMVSPEKGIWHCFGCGLGGDVIKFVMLMEGLEFRPALELLARRAGIELKPLRGERGNGPLKERIFSANDWAVKYFLTSLIKNPRALYYVTKKRKFNKQTVTDFGIGFAPETWEGLTKLLLKKGFKDHELVSAGLAGKKHGIYDLFRGRIMLPICDATGRVLGFTGRVLDDSEPKYLNTPQTLLYDKSRAIYGLHLAKAAIRAADEVVLVEGNMDVIASHQAGVKQVVGVSGTALTMDQLKTLSRHSKNIKLAFDQDAAGLAATERAIELGQKLGVTLRIVETPGAKDPDELIQKDPVLWQKAIKDAKYIVDYLFDRFEHEYDLEGAVGKRQFTDRLAANLKRLGDPVEQDHYVKLLAQKTGVSEESIKQKIDQTSHSTPPIHAAKPVQPVATEKQSARQMLEEAVLGANLAWPDVRLSLDDLEPEDFQDADRRDILRAMVKDKSQTADQLARSLPNQSDYVKILSLRGEEEFASLAPADRSLEAFGLTRRLQNLARKDLKTNLSQQLRAAEQSGDAELARSLLQKYQALSREEV